jgi:3,4-dihydroxy 2-butanone 4-phosphate synthase / GTP cyclohydrolase II
VFCEADIEHVVLTTESIQDNPLVRLHSECITGDVFSSLRCDCGEQLHQSLQQIASSKNGLLIYFTNHEGRGIGIGNKIKAYALQDQGFDTVDANHQLGFPTDVRDFKVAKDIFDFFGVQTIRLLTNNPEKIRHMTEMGINVSETLSFAIAPNPHNESYLSTKKKKLGHL